MVSYAFKKLPASRQQPIIYLILIKICLPRKEDFKEINSDGEHLQSTASPGHTIFSPYTSTGYYNISPLIPSLAYVGRGFATDNAPSIPNPYPNIPHMFSSIYSSTDLGSCWAGRAAVALPWAPSPLPAPDSS